MAPGGQSTVKEGSAGTGFEISEYLDLFLTEAQEQLQILNDDLLKFENETGDKELINEMFRAAHSLKGSSASMGFLDVSKITHKVEDILDRYRSGEIKATGPAIDVIFTAMDLVRETIFSNDPSNMDQEKYHLTVSKLEEIISSPEQPSAASCTVERLQLNEYEQAIALEAISQEKSLYEIIVEFNENAQMKSVRAFLILNNLSAFGEVLKTVPDVETLENEDCYNEIRILMIMTSGTREQLLQAADVTDSKKIEVNLFSLESHVPANAAAGDLLENASAASTEKDTVIAVTNEVKSKNESIGYEKQTETAKPKAIERKSVDTIRVDTDRLDTLMNLIGELLISQTKFVDLSRKLINEYGNNHFTMAFSEESALLGRITTALQDGLMKTRMLPISVVFNRFPRVVRDLARGRGKEIQLDIFGEETELDKTIVDVIGEPLMHLIRNSVDHGIESPEERKASGKPLKGKVELRAFHEGSQIIVQIQDDGKGINAQKVLVKAREKGLVGPDAQLTEQEMINLLFQPGFSTADEITDVSGRGVGMDVVKRTITSLNGLIEVKTEVGKGSLFTIKLPLTLAIIQALLVGVGNQVFAIPLANVLENFQVLPQEIKSIKNQEVINVRGEVIPILSISDMFDIPKEKNEQKRKSKYRSIVMIGSAEQKLGLEVDRLMGQQEVVIKSLNTPWLQTPCIAGATILGDGRVIMILNVPEIFSNSKSANTQKM